MVAFLRQYLQTLASSWHYWSIQFSNAMRMRHNSLDQTIHYKECSAFLFLFVLSTDNDSLFKAQTTQQCTMINRVQSVLHIWKPTTTMLCADIKKDLDSCRMKGWPVSTLFFFSRIPYIEFSEHSHVFCFLPVASFPVRSPAEDDVCKAADARQLKERLCMFSKKKWPLF